jgi:hypothetical protein
MKETMKNGKVVLRVLLTVLVLGIVFAGCSTTQARSSDSSIVSVGTGFFISSDGYIVTCAHVVDKADTIGIWVGDKGYRAELVAKNNDIDLAILKVDYKPSYVFRLANLDSAHTGDDVYALGFPLSQILGSEVRATNGIISAMSGNIAESRQKLDMQISASIQPGNSGGPVVNKRFEVLAVAASGLEKGTNVNFAVKNTYITPLLPRNVKIAGGNVRSMQDAIKATVQISVDDIYDGPKVTVVNNTRYSVRGIYISPSTHSSYGKNRLRNNQVLDNNGSIPLNLTFAISHASHYDFLVEDTNGNMYQKKNVIVAEGAEIVFIPADKVTSSNNLTGTYSYGSNNSITFNGNNFTLKSDSTTVTGSYSVSGNTFTLTGHRRTESWIKGEWTINDSNTLRDPDGDLWRKQTSTASTNTSTRLTGTYSFDPNNSITFNGNNFTLKSDSTTVTGSYSVSGNTFTLTGHGRTESFLRGTWTINNSNTLRDPDGDLWRKQTSSM